MSLYTDYKSIIRNEITKQINKIPIIMLCHNCTVDSMILEVIPYYAPAMLGYQNKHQAWHDEL